MMNCSITTTLVLGLASLAVSLGCVRRPVAPDKACVFPEREITVDGNVADWSGATWHDVSKTESQWLGQGITAEGWSGPADLSYRWAGAWDGKGRESLLIWHSGQVDFWLTMDHYGTVLLRKDSNRKSEGTQ